MTRARALGGSLLAVVALPMTLDLATAQDALPADRLAFLQRILVTEKRVRVSGPFGRIQPHSARAAVDGLHFAGST